MYAELRSTGRIELPSPKDPEAMLPCNVRIGPIPAKVKAARSRREVACRAGESYPPPQSDGGQGRCFVPGPLPGVHTPRSSIPPLLGALLPSRAVVGDNVTRC